MLVGVSDPASCVASAIRQLGHDPYPWAARDGYFHATACRVCGAAAATGECDGETWAEGAATMQPCAGWRQAPASGAVA